MLKKTSLNTENFIFENENQAKIAASVALADPNITQEEKTLLSLKECRDIIDPVINKFSGRIFHTAGDSVMAEFKETQLEGMKTHIAELSEVVLEVAK